MAWAQPNWMCNMFELKKLKDYILKVPMGACALRVPPNEYCVDALCTQVHAGDIEQATSLPMAERAASVAQFHERVPSGVSRALLSHGRRFTVTISLAYRCAALHPLRTRSVPGNDEDEWRRAG